MQWPELNRRTKFLFLIVFLISCIVALPTLPVMSPWGLDLHNVHVFQQCAAGRSPYLVDAATCGDTLNRPFFYPPFLFALFRWLRPLSLAAAMYIWTVFLFASFAAIFYMWAKKIAAPAPHGERHELVTFCVLMLFQYPFVFALERGSTDTVTVLVYTLAAYLFVRRQVWLAGMAAGFAAGFKLSPAIAVLVMTGAMLWAWRRIGGWTWLRFGGGALTAFALTLLLFLGDAKIYLADVLPKYAKELSHKCEYCHSLPTFVGDSFRNYAKLMSVCLLAPWVWAGARTLARGDVALAFAGALAVSTYVQGTSYDYNLVSTYPLLLLLFLQAQRTNRWALLAFGLFTIVGDRRLFSMPGAHVLTPHLHFVLQLAFLVVAALIIGRPREDEPARPPPAAAPAGAG